MPQTSDHGIGAIGRAQCPDLIEDRFVRGAGNVDDMIGAEFFGDGEPAFHGIETDDATRAAGFGHCRAIEAEKPEPLNDDCVAQSDFGGVTDAMVATPQFNGVASSSLRSGGSFRIQVPGRM